MSTRPATPSRLDPEVVTFGCRLNALEGEVMRRRATEAGLSNVVVFNTCAVTQEAERQARQAIRRTRRERPDALLVATGCAVQIAPARFAQMPQIDRILGNPEKLLPDTFRRIAAPGATDPRVNVGDIMQPRGPERTEAAGIPARGRAFLAVQNGCDHRCTFCVIPYGRGPSRSVPLAQVVEGIERLVDDGVREVVLTGVDLTSWGADLPGHPRLGELVRGVLAGVPSLARLRLSSIDQAEADPTLLAAFAEEERLMPHLHLSLQHGSDIILKRMKRRHSRAEAIAFCAELRRRRSDIAIGADLIAGFPTESEDHFADLLSLVDACGLSQVHAFPFSARPGTPAARMPQVPQGALNDRTTRLVEKGRSVLSTWLAGHVGGTVTAVLEGSGPRDGRARTPQFAQARVTGLPPGMAAGQTVAARVTGYEQQRLLVEALR